MLWFCLNHFVTIDITDNNSTIVRVTTWQQAISGYGILDYRPTIINDSDMHVNIMCNE